MFLKYVIKRLVENDLSLVAVITDNESKIIKKSVCSKKMFVCYKAITISMGFVLIYYFHYPNSRQIQCQWKSFPKFFDT